MAASFVILLLVCQVIAAFDLEIISTIPNNISVGVALPWSGSALKISTEHARKVFAGDLNITLTLLYNTDDRTCDDTDSAAPLLLADYYYTKSQDRCVVNIGSGRKKKSSHSPTVVTVSTLLCPE